MPLPLQDLAELPDYRHSEGFTLIELSIVLVIIGLIVGGILTGRDLIAAAAIRSQVAQLEKYQTATNTFKGKYNALPGDMNVVDATRFGFVTRGTQAGQGDGNGILEGNSANAPGSNDGGVLCGENILFWRDLSQVNLVDGTFNSATATSTAAIPKAQVLFYFPQSTIAVNGAVASPSVIITYSNGGVNYYGLQGIFGILPASPATFVQPNLTVRQAYALDSKIDDGKAQLGNVIAATVNVGGSFSWADGSIGISSPVPDTSVFPGSATTCADNNNITGYRNYSVSQNNGTGLNCYLSMKFQ